MIVIAWCYDCNCIVEVICAYHVALQGYMLIGRLASEKLKMRETEQNPNNMSAGRDSLLLKACPEIGVYIATKYISDIYGSLSCL